MALHRVSNKAGNQTNREPNHPSNHQDSYFNGRDVMGMSVYSADNQKMGRVCELLADESENIRYLVVRLGLWKKVLLPVEQAEYVSRTEDTHESSSHEARLYVSALTQNEFKALASYHDDQIAVDQPSTQQYEMAPLEQSIRAGRSATNFTPSSATTYILSQNSAEQTSATQAVTPTTTSVGAQGTSRAASPDQLVQLYEERLVTQKQRVKTGEVKIFRRTVTDSANVSVPVTKEKIIIEIESLQGGETRVELGDAQVGEDGSVRMGIYEDQVDICRRIVPYQTVSVRKEVVRDIVEAQETLRREELSVESDGADYVDRRSFTQGSLLEERFSEDRSLENGFLDRSNFSD
jgi:uncharacterized protein (TIGR02271 family)